MNRGAPDSPGEVRPGATPDTDIDHAMTNDKERGEKRGVLSTGRAIELDKTKDADADADDEEDED